MIGKTLAGYEVVAELGAGGMGEVYRARDPKLGRDVALKILPDAFARDEERLARFEREARLLASLNHPNIGAIYGLEQADGQRFLVLELVEGEDLAERLARGRMETDEVLRVARQVAEAVEAAHEQGVVHRDLKPANIKITPEGRVKVLDFGLAKALDLDGGSHDLSHSPTVMASSPTMAGVILGTAAYMSPEQARGKAVDRRADIWAFGVILWEMLAGRQLFAGETISDTLAAVIRADIEISALPKGLPASLKVLIERCLDRDPSQRLRDIGEARVLIQKIERGEVDATPAASPGAAPPVKRRSTVWTLLPYVLFAGALILAAVLGYRGRGGEAPLIRATIPPPPGTAFNLVSNHPGPAVLSPDGTMIAFVANGVLYVRALDQLDARALPGTENAGYPFWSPDSRAIGFFADGKLKRVDAAGGPPLSICDAPNGKGGSWSEAGTIVFALTSNTGISRVSATGGEPVELTTRDTERREDSHRFPQFLPDGKHFLFFARAGDESTTRLGDIDGGVDREILRARGQARYASGYLFFPREGTLMAQKFDADSAELQGEAEPVVSDVRLLGAIPYSVYSVSETGALIYMSGGSEAGGVLTWRDREGNTLGTVGEAAAYGDYQLSPDDTRVCIEIVDPKLSSADLWIIDLDTGLGTRFTFGDRDEFDPVWSADGKNIIFSSDRTGQHEFYRKSVEGAEQAELIFENGKEKHAYSWSADERYLLFQQSEEGGEVTAWGLDLETKETIPIADGFRPQFSPDDRWVVYRGYEAGKRPIYVQRFPEAGRKWQVSSGDGVQPRWAGNGNIYYQTLNGEVIEVKITTGDASIRLGGETKLYETQSANQFHVTADGTRFLEVVDQQADQGAPLILVTNWLAALESRR